MTVNEIIKLLNKEENKFGGATGKERELNLSVNGDFIGIITSAELDGFGDGLITDVTLEVEVDGIEYLEQEIRAKTIDEFVNTLIPRLTDAIYQKDVESMSNLINDVARELKAGEGNEID